MPRDDGLLSRAFDGGACGVPKDTWVVPVTVQFEHGRDDVGDAVLLVDDAAEVAQVLLGRADAFGQVGRADALVPGFVVVAGSPMLIHHWYFLPGGGQVHERRNTARPR